METVSDRPPEGEPGNVTPLVLDAVVLMERRVEFIGRRISMTLPDSGRVEGELVNAFWRGWDTPLSQRIGITMRDGRSFLVGDRTRITLEQLVDEDREPLTEEQHADAFGGREVTYDRDRDERGWEPGSSYTGPLLDAIRDELAEGPEFGYFGERAPELVESAVEPAPGRRTVSLEVLTAELRALANAERAAEAARFNRDDADLVGEHARAGIVSRVGGRAVGVPYVDTDWVYESGAHGFASLVKQAQGIADQDGADLLMPTPDVLAVLAGETDVRLLTAPVHVLAMDVTVGMWLVGEIAGTEHLELVVGTPKCGLLNCEHGVACKVLTIADGVFEVSRHVAGYARTEVRIPAAAAVVR
ncbi:hypothetical protein ABZS66_18980 [Dactylosporangium sp. NPDC005572]|uniref:hypothetical protein n=1 Tax=Dactylosporangium sp. NPDC005572 TaxID=3156889 RepID=UPI0033AEBD54